MPSPFETTRMGEVVLPNRLLMAPIKTGYGSATGEITQRHVDFYVRRAVGGVGLITLEPMYIQPSGKELPNQMGLHNDAVIEGLRRLTDRIHQAGAKVAVHLNHAGRMANPKAAGLPPVSASAVPCPVTGVHPRALSKAEIDSLVDSYAQAARRAWQAGVDVLELQCGHGYLIAQFLSPLVNTRTDAYGGTPENRMRFALEILNAMKSEVGAHVPVICRLSAREFVPRGLTLQDSTHLAIALQQGGADALHVSGGSACESPAWYFQHSALPDREFLADTGALKAAVTIPVIAVGRLGTPERVREAFEDFGADLVALGRPLIADPDFPLKMRTGNHDTIRPCGACLQGCLSMVRAGKGLSCVINPMVGREGEIRVTLAERPRKVMIVGGGPAGLEAGIVAAARGHRVDLYERDQLGGQFRLASKPPMKEGMKVAHDYLLSKTRMPNLHVHLGQDVDLGMVMAQAPDVVVVATGAEPVIPDIAGLEALEYTTGHDVFSGASVAGPRVLIIGGGMVGVETAEYLANQGKTVTVLEMLSEIARDMEAITRALLLKRIAHLPVQLLTDTVAKRFEKEQVIIETNGTEACLPRFDSVVFTVGTRSVDTLSTPLRRQGFEVLTVGDSKNPRQVLDAIREGFEAGLAV